MVTSFLIAKVPYLFLINEVPHFINSNLNIPSYMHFIIKKEKFQLSPNKTCIIIMKKNFLFLPTQQKIKKKKKSFKYCFTSFIFKNPACTNILHITLHSYFQVKFFSAELFAHYVSSEEYGGGISNNHVSNLLAP